MGAQGTDTIDFGAFPGKSDTFKDIAVASVLTTSLVEAWIRPAATADHTADEHMVETLKVFGVCTVNGTIRIYGFNTSEINEPTPTVLNRNRLDPSMKAVGTRIWGLWTVAWVWN